MNNIIFFDSTCLICDKSIQFIYKLDRKKEFYFASLNSHKAISLPPEIKIIDSVIFYEDGHYYGEFMAIKRIISKLGYGRLYKFLSLLPESLGNLVYRFIAKNRFKFFPQTKYCEFVQGLPDRLLE